MDMSPYRDLFVSEARNHLSAFSALIVHIEESPGDSAAIHELFRHAHSLKGMAATMGYEQLVAIAHTMEGQMGRIRNGEFPLVPALADLLLEEADALARQILLIETGSSRVEEITPLIKRLAVFAPTAELLQQSHDETPCAGE
jgi:two-component system chemotaxis sensor kinase CheA